MLRPALLYLSQNGLLKQLSTRVGPARRAAMRFVAGERLEDAIAVSRELSRQGASAEIDYLGENVRSRKQAEAAAGVYLRLLDRIATEGVDAQVSLKPTQTGLDLGQEICLANLKRIVETAAGLGNFVWLDMEGSGYTDLTLEIYRQLRAEHSNVGVALQSYLYRSEKDVQDVLAMGGTVRLCKGAYMESPRVAYPRKADVDRNFVRLAEVLLSSHRFQAIATHDQNMVVRVVRFARDNGIPPRQYEFQMLLGVRRDLQQRLVREGYRLRVYVPYGSEWYPYLMRRLAERPANLLFILSSVAKEAVSRNGHS